VGDILVGDSHLVVGDSLEEDNHLVVGDNHLASWVEDCLAFRK
jgi:hypothetical protein